MKWKVITLCLCLLSVCLAVLLLSCEEPWLWGIEQRLQDTRADLATQVRAFQLTPGVRYPRSLAQQLQFANILAALSLADSLGLRDPTICCATFYPQSSSGQSRLVVYWIEDQPTAESVRLVWEDGRTRDFRISPEENEAHRTIAKHAVVYDTVFVFSNDSAEAKELDADPAASVVLLKGEKEITSRWPLVMVER